MRHSDSNGPTLTLPASWYSSPDLYELERRSIFAKHWLLVTHQSRFIDTGNYLSFTIAGWPFFIVKDKLGELNAFFNVCRHRAFPVVQKDEGTARILACKYHGWSYSLNGNLAKAPKFDTAPGFDGSEYSLFRIHLKIDARGFVWINFDAADTPSVSWDQHLRNVDLQPRLQYFNMDEYRFDHAWSMDGEYNWKTLIDNYNECYHCSVAHPGIAKTTNLNSYNVETSANASGYIEHYAEAKGNEDDEAGPVAPTYMFPNASITMTKHYFYLMRVVPTSATSVSMQYEVYRHTSAPDDAFESIDAFFKQVEAEDKFLCTNAQKNLNAGAYTSGPLHPHNEKGVLHFQGLVRRIVMEHREREKELGKKVSPEKRMPDNKAVKDDDLFCSGLCGDGNGKGELSW